MTIHKAILTNHHPECHVFLFCFSLEVPVVDKNIMI